jgi:hypothetical protein
LPAVQKALNDMLAASLNGQLHSGDSIGVWTFDQDLHTGKFPLQHWNAGERPMIASNINKFVGKQHYSNVTSFDALQPQLNQVMQGSERLTVLIFCDGGDEIKWTPYGINQVFQQRLAEQKKTRSSLCCGLNSANTPAAAGNEYYFRRIHESGCATTADNSRASGSNKTPPLLHQPLRSRQPMPRR